MKSQNGVTLTSLIIYVIAMSIIVATVATLTNYFHGNINGILNRTSASKEFTQFNSYFVNEVNNRDNSVLEELMNTQGDTKIVFSSGNQFTFAGNAIYFNKVKICKEVTSCRFSYDSQTKKITFIAQFNGKTFNNEYTMQNDI